jgi:hypothetical protein
MAEVELRSAVDVVLDHREVEEYVRDAKLALVNATGYVVVLVVYAVMRVVLDVPYVRAAVGPGLLVAAGAVALKCRLAPTLPRARTWFSLSAGSGVVVGSAALVTLVEINRGTLFAAATAGLAAAVVTHVVDRVALSRA